jgi:hypothetical protein
MKQTQHSSFKTYCQLPRKVTFWRCDGSWHSYCNFDQCAWCRWTIYPPRWSPVWTLLMTSYQKEALQNCCVTSAPPSVCRTWYAIINNSMLTWQLCQHATMHNMSYTSIPHTKQQTSVLFKGLVGILQKSFCKAVLQLHAYDGINNIQLI